MKRICRLVVITSLIWATGAKAHDWEGTWGLDQKDCKEGGSIVLEKDFFDLSSFEMTCSVQKIAAVGGKSIVDIDCSGEGSSMKRKVALRVTSDRLLIQGLEGYPESYLRCPSTSQKSN